MVYVTLPFIEHLEHNYTRGRINALHLYALEALLGSPRAVADVYAHVERSLGSKSSHAIVLNSMCGQVHSREVNGEFVGVVLAGKVRSEKMIRQGMVAVRLLEPFIHPEIGRAHV